MPKYLPHRNVSANRGKWLCIAACVVILAVAAAVRIFSAFNDLWLDEIWSLYLAGHISSVAEIFTKIHHDNNHYLNTLYLYLVGPQGNWPGYRIPSILAGIGTVAVAGLIGRRRNRASAFLAMLLVGFSYVLVLYSSEAKGYAPAVFFSLLSFYLLDFYLERKSWQIGLMFSISVVLGFLSHLTFLYFYLAALVWSGYRLMKSRSGLKQIMSAAFSCHALPCLFLTALYMVDIRHIVMGGGPPMTLLNGYVNALVWALGTPWADFMVPLSCIAAVVILYAGLSMLWREKSDSWVFFIGVIFVFPIFLGIIASSNVFYVRFFIISIAFLLILTAFVLADIYNRGSTAKAICALLLLGYLTANGWQMSKLFTYGRGHYSEAVGFLAEHSNGSPVTIGGDHDFRIGMVLRFYCPAVIGAITTNTTRRTLCSNTAPSG